MKKRKIDILQNTVIFLLFLSMVGMSVLTFVMTSLSDELDIDGQWFDMSFIAKEDSANKDELELSLLLPAVSGIKTDTLKLCTFADEEHVSEFYSFFANTLKNICSAGSVLVEASVDFSLSEQIESSNYVFVKYRSPMPLSVVVAFLGAETYSDISVSGRISDVFLFEKGNGTEAVIITEEGKTYVFDAPSVALNYGILENFAYTNRSHMCDFKFSCEADISDFASDTVLLTAGNKVLPVYEIEELNAYEAVESDSLASLFEVFSFNPDKLSSSKPTEDSITYVENHGTLNIGSTVTYTAISGGGVDIASYVDNGSSYGIERFIRASAGIAHMLERSLVQGGAAKLRLNSVSSEDGELVIKYVYTLGNIPIMSDSLHCGLVLRFSEDKLVGASVDVIRAENTGERSSMFTGLWSAELYSSRNPDKLICDMAAYYNAGEDIKTGAAWQVLFLEGGQVNELD